MPVEREGSASETNMVEAEAEADPGAEDRRPERVVKDPDQKPSARWRSLSSRARGDAQVEVSRVLKELEERMVY